MLPWSWAVERLAASRNYWIGSTRVDGRPHVSPVWGIWIDDSVVWSSSARSVKARNLAREPSVVVHLESGDEVVILEGRAELLELDARIADAFSAKYDWRPDPDKADGDPWFRLRSAFALAWYERDYPKTATRYTF
jgi:hypothetical protein